MNDIHRYYQILGLEYGASQDEIKIAYKDLVKVWHPDRFQGDSRLLEKAQEKLKEINEANDKLKKYRPDVRYEKTYQSTKRNTTENKQSYDYSKTSSKTESANPVPKKSDNNWCVWIVVLFLLGGVAKYVDRYIKENAKSKNNENVADLIPKIEDKSTKNHILNEIENKKVISKKNKDIDVHQINNKRVSKHREVKQNDVVVNNAKYFIIGSTKDEVIAIQGTPDSFSENEFRYGLSRVYFNNGKVKSWDNSGYPKLKVKIITKSNIANDYFTIGSTKYEVTAIQGTPDSFSENEFRYGLSRVYFNNGKVKSWDNSGYPKLKVKISVKGTDKN